MFFTDKARRSAVLERREIDSQAECRSKVRDNAPRRLVLKFYFLFQMVNKKLTKSSCQTVGNDIQF